MYQLYFSVGATVGKETFKNLPSRCLQDKPNEGGMCPTLSTKCIVKLIPKTRFLCRLGGHAVRSLGKLTS